MSYESGSMSMGAFMTRSK